MAFGSELLNRFYQGNAYPLVSLSTLVTLGTGLLQINGYVLFNGGTVPAFLELWDTTGTVMLGTTVPTVIIPITANSTPANGSGIVVPFSMQIKSGTIKVAAVTAPNGTTAVSVGLSGTIFAA